MERLRLEYLPYKIKYGNQSIFKTLNENNNSPFRVSAIGKKYQSTLRKDGMEILDYRGPIHSRHFKEFVRLIVTPQLKTKQQQDWFDNYWYNIDVNFDDQPGDGIIPLNIPLLLLMNVKYLISNIYNSDFEKISNKIIKSKHDDENIPQPVALIKQLGGKHINMLNKISYPPIYIYELKNTVERGYLARKMEVLPSDQEVLKKISNMTLNDLKETAFFSNNDFTDAELPKFKNISSNLFQNNKIDMVHYSPDKIIFNASLSSPAVLIVTNNYYPKWTASINGSNTNIFRVNHAFQSILLNDKGNHEIIFEYKDQLLWLLHSFIPLGVLLINFPLLYITYRTRRKQ